MSVIVGSGGKKRPGKKVEIEGRSFTQANQSEPIPVCYGTQRRAGTFIVPPYGLRAVEQKTKAGK